jgi:hypothetical protein
MGILFMEPIHTLMGKSFGGRHIPKHAECILLSAPSLRRKDGKQQHLWAHLASFPKKVLAEGKDTP